MSIVSYIDGTGKVMEGTVKGGVGTGDVAQIYGSNVVLDQQIETIELGGNIADFTFKQAGNRLEIYKGTTLVAKTGLQSDADGTQLVFSDGAVDAKYDSSNLEMSLGGTVVGTGAAHAVTPATVDATKTSTVSASSTGSSTGGAGQTFTLTTGADNFKGGSGDDVFDSALTDTNNPTIQTIDSLIGGEGTDTLNITANKATDVLGGALVDGIENINVRALASIAASFDASGAPGVKNINAKWGAGSLVATKLPKGAEVSITGNGTVANGEVAFAYKTPTDPVTLNLDGGLALTGTTKITNKVSLGGASDIAATTATINSKGDALNTVKTVDLSNAALTSVTFNLDAALKGDFLSEATDQVAADGKVTLKGAAKSVEFTAALDNDIKTIDATGLTKGGLKATLGTGVESYKGGSGVDEIVLAAGVKEADMGAGDDIATAVDFGSTPAKSGKISGGEGSDTLKITAANQFDTEAEILQYASFENLSFAVGSNLDMDKFSGVEKLILALDAAGATNLTAEQAKSIDVVVDNGSANTISLKNAKGTSDVLGLVLKNATATASADMKTLTANGFETLNVTSSSGSSSDISELAFASADKLAAINIDGDKSLALTLTNLKAVTVKSNQTGEAVLNVDGNAAAGSSITTSKNGDQITLGTAAGASYNAGAGKDKFVATAVTQLRSGELFNKIDGGEGEDTLTLTANAITMVDNDFKGISGIEKIVLDADGGGGDVNIKTGGWYNQAFKDAGIDLTLKSADTDVLTFDGSSFTGKQTLKVESAGVGDGSGEEITVLTGSGADDIDVQLNDWTGGGTTSAVKIESGAGNDKIKLSTGTLDNSNATAPVIDAGKGADEINLVHIPGNVSAQAYIALKVEAGDSTLTAYDKVTGFKLGDNVNTKSSDALDFDATAAIQTAVTKKAVSGHEVGELAIAINGTTGLVTFSGTEASDITVKDALAAIDAVMTNGKTAIWNDGTDTYVFNADAAGDSVVELVGVTGTSLITTNAATADAVFLL